MRSCAAIACFGPTWCPRSVGRGEARRGRISRILRGKWRGRLASHRPRPFCVEGTAPVTPPVDEQPGGRADAFLIGFGIGTGRAAIAPLTVPRRCFQCLPRREG